MSLEDIIYSNSFLLELSRKVMGLGNVIAPSIMIRLVFRFRQGKWPNLKHPQTFNEKIQWMRLHDDSDSRKTLLVDKYLVRDWIREKIGDQYLIPLIGVWDSVDDIGFSQLPEKFVLKANHGSGWNIIVKDKKSLNIKDTKKKLQKWLSINYGKSSLEPQYINVPPKIIAEEYIENSIGELLDYKIHCYGGEPQYIQCMTGRASHATLQEKIYDLNWNELPFVQNYPRYAGDITKPADLPQLVGLARKLSKDFNYVRVDFYVLDDGSIKFGEMTFTPGAGVGTWNLPEYNLEFGKLIKLPIDE